MKPEQLERVLRAAIRGNQPVMVTGPPGIGKSDIIEQAAATEGAEYMTVHCVTSDPTDPKGLGFASPDGKSAEFLPYGDMVRIINATSPLVVHLEDFGQAAPAVQAAYMQAILARRVGEHKISPFVTWIASTNRRQDKAGVGGILEPVKGRFTILELVPDLDAVCNWMLGNGFNPADVNFLRFRPELLHDFKATSELTNSPNPRNWAALFNFLSVPGLESQDEYEIARGRVGEGAAGEYMAYRDIRSKLVAPEAVLANPDGAEVPSNPGVIYALVGALAHIATEDNMDAVVTYAQRLAPEYGVLLIDSITRQRPELMQTRAYIAWGIRYSKVL